MTLAPVHASQRGHSWFERLFTVRNTHDQHSLFLTGAAILLTATLVFDLVYHDEDFNPFLVVALICITTISGVLIAVLGHRFPLWAGQCCVGIFTAVSLIFVSALMTAQPAVSTMQEFPIIALYVSWFVAIRFARWVMLTIVACFGLVMAMNPLFGFSGGLGAASAAQSLLIMLVCFECGLTLRKRTTRRVSVDQLTGVLNRNGFLVGVAQALNKQQRSITPMSLIVLDFDDFKQLNDSQGHAAGDAALQQTVNHWKDNLRAKDLIGRTGGDEFAILLDRTDASGAQATIARIRHTSPHSFTWGVSQARPGDTVEELFARADDVLYQFKRRRRGA